MLIPAPPLLLAGAGLLLLALLASIAPVLDPAFAAAAAMLLLAAVIDGRRLLRRAPPSVRRRAPHALALGTATEITLQVAADERHDAALQLFDHVPAGCSFDGLPCSLALRAGATASLRYTLRAQERGELAFGRAELRLASPWRLWRRRVYVGAPATVRVYPNFVALTRFALLATDHRLSQLGILQRRRRGQGMEFHQLREYREGDVERQIDWKTSARMRRLISREYRDDRDQQVLLLLDCGRRMAARDGELAHFDHALNAALLLAHVALRQGDAVGLMTLGGVDRWLEPRKSAKALNTLLGTVFDLQPTLSSPDFQAAAVSLTSRLRKRSLVVLLSNLRDEDDDGLRAALGLLRQRHLVVLASLREPILDAALRAPIDTLDDALTHAATADYLEQRRHSFASLEQIGVPCLDVEPSGLPLALVNRYTELKRAGRL